MDDINLLFYSIFIITLIPFPNHLLISLVLSIILAIKYFKLYLYENKNKFWKSFDGNLFIFVLFLMLIAYSIISVFWVIDYLGWIYHNSYLFIGLVMSLSANYLLVSKNDFTKLFKIFVFITAIHNILGWINVLTGKYIFSFSPLIQDFKEKGNPLSVFNNTNDLATFLVFALFIIILLQRLSEEYLEKLLYGILIGSSLLLLQLTMSRGSMIALIIGLATYIFLMTTYKTIILILTSLLSLISLILYLIPGIFVRINDYVTSNLLGVSESIRLNLIKNGFSFVKETFGFGVGAGNVSYYLENLSVYPNYETNTLHNWWLDILVTYGVFIFIIYLIYYYLIIKGLYLNVNNKSQTKFQQLTAYSFISILISYIIGSISTSSNFPILWIWVFFGIVISFLSLDSKKIQY